MHYFPGSGISGQCDVEDCEARPPVVGAGQFQPLAVQLSRARRRADRGGLQVGEREASVGVEVEGIGDGFTRR